jgi:hypothetical protein
LVGFFCYLCTGDVLDQLPQRKSIAETGKEEKDTRGGGNGLQSVAASAEKALSCRIAILGGKHRPV